MLAMAPGQPTSMLNVMTAIASKLAPTGKHSTCMSGILCLEKNRKQLGLGFDPQFAVHVFLMDFHGFDRDFQLTGDFFTGATAEHQAPDIQLPGGQLRAFELLHRRFQLHAPVDLAAVLARGPRLR